jgi:hypothetical protein
VPISNTIYPEVLFEFLLAADGSSPVVSGFLMSGYRKSPTSRPRSDSFELSVIEKWPCRYRLLAAHVIQIPKESNLRGSSYAFFTN